MSKSIAKSYINRYLGVTIFAQARSEGIGATLIQTQQVLDGMQNAISFDNQLVIKNLQRAYFFVEENLDNSLSFEDICYLNSLVSDHTNLHPGKLRRDDVFVYDQNYQSWYPELPDEFEIRESLYNIGNITNPVDRAFETFLFISRTKIFENCNNRTAFLLTNKIFLENSIGIMAPPIDTKMDEKYKILLVEYYKNYDTSSKLDICNFMKQNCINNTHFDSVRKQTGKETIDIDVANEYFSKFKTSNLEILENTVDLER